MEEVAKVAERVDKITVESKFLVHLVVPQYMFKRLFTFKSHRYNLLSSSFLDVVHIFGCPTPLLTLFFAQLLPKQPFTLFTLIESLLSQLATDNHPYFQNLPSHAYNKIIF